MTDEAPIPRQPEPRRGMAPGTIIALLMILAGVATAIAIYVRRHDMADAARKLEEKTPKSADDLPKLGFGPIGDFTLTERSGKTITADSLRGRVWVAETGFSYCGAVCPAMNRTLAKLHFEFDGKEEPKFVSVSVDPTRDTPGALQDHARTYQADPDRWWWLTGDQKQLQLLANSLLLPYQPGVPSSHSSKYVLVDRDGWVRGAYDSSQGPEVDNLRRDLKLLLDAPAKKN